MFSPLSDFKIIRKKKHYKVIKFIEVTHRMLNEVDQKRNIICWDEDGIKILIIDKEQLKEKVLPQYFKHSNYSSFLRQLNMYGFVSSKNQDGYLTYYHPSFSKKSVVMKNIQKKHQKKQDQKCLDCYVSEQTELKDQIMQLQQQQVSLQQNLIASIKSQLKIKESIKKILQFKLQLAKEGQRNCEKFIFTIRILAKAMEPISQQEILQFFKQVFPEGAEDQLQPSDFFPDLDANNQSQFSPAPFGKTAFDESYIMNRDSFELDSDLFVFGYDL